MKLTMADILEKLKSGERVDVECKAAESTVPKSAYESYSAFANTNGGYIFLGILENRKKKTFKERFEIQGIANADNQIKDLWNTFNSNKVNVNILIDENIYPVTEGDVTVIVIDVPRADYKTKPVYIGENPYKGTFKRNYEGDYHATEYEIRAMIRDQYDGNDDMVVEYSTMDDIDEETLKAYRQIFRIKNPDHVWSSYDDKRFLTMLGGYRKDKKKNIEGLTLAGLMMFGKGFSIRDEFSNIFMDYRDESDVSDDVRWNDRITYDGTWENNLFNFFTKVTRKLTADLPKPFKLDGMQRVDDTPVHKAVREAFVNLIIHSDYLMDAGVLKVIKLSNGFAFSNPGLLKISKEEIYRGGNSRARNPKMQTMLRMVGFGDNAGSGFPLILNTWKENGWVEPELEENFGLNQVTLTLSFEKQTLKTNDKKHMIKGQEKGQEKRQEKGQEIKERMKLVIDLIREDSSISVANIAKQLELSDKKVRVAIDRLRDSGVLHREGNDRGGKWIINEDNLKS